MLHQSEFPEKEPLELKNFYNYLKIIHSKTSNTLYKNCKYFAKVPVITLLGL